MAEDNMYCRLSEDLKLACEIYHYNFILNKPISVSTMVSSLAWVMTKSEVWHSLCALEDYSVVYREAGDLGNGRAGFAYHIQEFQITRTRELYEEHWKNYRRDLVSIPEKKQYDGFISIVKSVLHKRLGKT